MIGNNNDCPLCQEAVKFLLFLNYDIGYETQEPPQFISEKLLLDRYYSQWIPTETPQTSSNYDVVQWDQATQHTINLIQTTIEDHVPTDKQYTDPPYYQLFLTFTDHSELLALPNIPIRAKYIPPTAKKLYDKHSPNLCNPITTITNECSCESLSILINVLVALLDSDYLPTKILASTLSSTAPYIDIDCQYKLIDVMHLPFHNMITTSFTILINQDYDAIIQILAGDRAITSTQVHFDLTNFDMRLIPLRHIMNAIFQTHIGQLPHPDMIANEYAAILLSNTPLLDIFLQRTHWTNKSLTTAATPGAWLSDTLYNILTMFYMPTAHDGTYAYVPNNIYVDIYDLITEALFHRGIITELHRDYAKNRNYNNKGNSMELLSLRLWDIGEHLLLISTIWLALAMEPTFRHALPAYYGA
jgi:hypothetical protein